MDRRKFLHNVMHSTAGFTLMGQFNLSQQLLLDTLPVNPENDHILVVIFLNGGNDELNTLISKKQLSIYDKIRPHVLLPENKLLDLTIDGLAFHPSIPYLTELQQEGRLTFIRGIGYDQPNYSHFRSSDIWLSGSDSDEVISTGWLGRHLNQTYPGYPTNYPTAQVPDPLSVEIGYTNSLLFQGAASNTSIVLNNERDLYQLIEDQGPTSDGTLAGDKLAHVQLVRQQSQVYGERVQNIAQQAPAQVSFPETPIGQQLKLVSKLIAGGSQTPIYKVELGGFDTHSRQVEVGDTTTGIHANLLKELDDAIKSFMADLKKHKKEEQVIGMVFTEFGRRPVSNSSLGTDHGAAGGMFLFGNQVSGQILGEDYELDTGMSFEDNLPHQFDYRQAYGSILEQWFCIDKNKVVASLGKPYGSIPLINPSACGLTSSVSKRQLSIDYLTISPNPSSGRLTIKMEKLKSLRVHIELLDMQGRIIKLLYAGEINQGKFDGQYDLSYLPSGTYLVNMQSASAAQTKVWEKV